MRERIACTQLKRREFDWFEFFPPKLALVVWSREIKIAFLHHNILQGVALAISQGNLITSQARYQLPSTIHLGLGCGYMEDGIYNTKQKMICCNHILKWRLGY